MQATKSRKELMNEIIANNYGTSAYHKLSPFSPVLCTDGVTQMAKELGAFWLVDAITSYNRREPFQVWTLEVKEGPKAVLTMREDSDQPAKVTQKIGCTDFPEGLWAFYLIDGILMLTSEY
jgi:hypothetical protein